MSDAQHLLLGSHSWSLYALFQSRVGFECLFWGGLLITMAYTVGLWTRVTPILFYIATWSLYQRDYYAIDGGENLLIIIAFYLMFADLSAISMDRHLGLIKDSRGGWFQAMLHNTAITTCLLQLATVYFVSDFYKIQGHVWSDGTALYYILRTNAFSLPPITDVLTRDTYLVVAGTYATIFFQAMYPWGIWHPRLKYIVLIGVVGLHASIAIFMGLVWFSLTMISVDVLLFNDDELTRFGKALAGPIAVARSMVLFRRAPRAAPAEP